MSFSEPSAELEPQGARSRSPHAALLVFSCHLSRCPGRELDGALSHVPLFHSSGLFRPLFQVPFSSEFSMYSQCFYCYLSFFHHPSSRYAFVFLSLPHPLLSPLYKQRIKETPVDKTCKRSVSPDDFHFIWAPPLTKWKGILC